MTAPITPAELDALESLRAKAKQECFCRFACECGSLDAERKLEALLPDAFPRLAAALRAAWEDADEYANTMDVAAHAALKDIGHKWDKMNNWGEAALHVLPDEARRLAAKLAEAERLLRLAGEFCEDHMTGDSFPALAREMVGQIARYFGQQTTPTAAAPQE